MEGGGVSVCGKVGGDVKVGGADEDGTNDEEGVFISSSNSSWFLSSRPVSNGPVSNGPVSNGPVSNGPVSSVPVSSVPVSSGLVSRVYCVTIGSAPKDGGGSNRMSSLV